MIMEDGRLASLRRQSDEEDDDFMKRFDLNPTDLARWKELTQNGKVYGGPALKRFFGDE
jgi:hypothetical protein